MLASGNVPVQYKTLPGGFQGTDQTVALMSQLATGQWGSRSAKIRALALNILAQSGVPEKDYLAEMVAIHNWVRDNIRYTRDVSGQETLLPPEELAFNSKAGDCDDKSMLDAALLGAIGIPTRFITIGVTPFNYSHVFLQAKPKSQWISLDPIMRDKPAGWEVPERAVKIRKVFPENIPQEMTMGRQGLNGPFDWYVGYEGGGFAHSHLSPVPRPGANQAQSPYVVMDSFADSDAPTADISRNAPAFPQQDGAAPPSTTAAQVRPTLQDRRVRSTMSTSAAMSRSWFDQQSSDDAEQEAANPMHGLHGHNGLLGPDQLADLGYSNGIDRQLPLANMQRPSLAQRPEGIDSMFTRPNMVLRTDKGDTIVYRGLYSLAEKPPIRPYTGMAGVPSGALPGMGGVRSSSLPGMGRMSGPGFSELADLADATVAAAAPAATAAVMPAPSKVPHLLALGAIALGAYLLFKRK